MRIDHHFVVVARRDIDGSEVNVDHEFATGLRGLRFVNVFFGGGERSESAETNECKGGKKCFHKSGGEDGFKSSKGREESKFSFVAQGNHGIDAGGATRGQETRERGHERE